MSCNRLSKPISCKMGNSYTAFSSGELDRYQDLTYFTKREILHTFQKFVSIASDELKAQVLANKSTTYLPLENLLELEELRANPFSERLCHAFSCRPDGALTFEDFLDMMSVMSDRAPKSLKIEYAFRIYDFGGDDMICADDVSQAIDLLLGEESGLSVEDRMVIVNSVLDEADLDNDRKLSFAEFEHVIAKAPDFLTSFRIRI